MFFLLKNISLRGLRPHIVQICVLFGLVLSATPAFSNDRNATIKQTKITQLKNKQTVVSFTFDKTVKYKVFTLKSPNRVVIDLDKTSDTMKVIGKKPAYLKQLRHAKRNTNDLRVVLDLKQVVIPKATMKGKQLQIALLPQSAKSTNKKTTQKKKANPKKPLKKIIKEKKKKPSPAIPRPRRGDFVVAIDAGHGGKDPGAVGAHGTREKDIVLQIARRLKQRIDRTPGMKAVLVRDGDYYISLRKRMEIARKKKANLFVSIHADANPNRRLTGSSVYILSQNGASSEAARWLASSENSYESKVGGTSLHGKDNALASMLMDLSQAATIDNSLSLAKNTLGELGRVTNLLHRRVESAAFVVLKSPDIPSMLVETAFISNPSEEKRLKTAQYQNKLAGAVFNGIKRFKVAYAPGGKLRTYANNSQPRQKTRKKSAKRRSPHVVRPGESLSVIAKKYGVNQNTLSLHNRLGNSSSIRIGQKLYIPTRS